MAGRKRSAAKCVPKEGRANDKKRKPTRSDKKNTSPSEKCSSGRRNRKETTARTTRETNRKGDKKTTARTTRETNQMKPLSKFVKPRSSIKGMAKTTTRIRQRIQTKKNVCQKLSPGPPSTSCSDVTSHGTDPAQSERRKTRSVKKLEQSEPAQRIPDACVTDCRGRVLEPGDVMWTDRWPNKYCLYVGESRVYREWRIRGAGGMVCDEETVARHRADRESNNYWNTHQIPSFDGTITHIDSPVREHVMKVTTPLPTTVALRMCSENIPTRRDRECPVFPPRARIQRVEPWIGIVFAEDGFDNDDFLVWALTGMSEEMAKEKGFKLVR